MRKYTPRRASKTRWLEGAPDYVLDVFDSKDGGERYTVMFTFPLSYVLGSDGKPLPEGQRGEYGRTYIQFLGMSGAPTHPQGVSMWGEMRAHEAAAYRYRVKHQRTRWLDLPEHIRAHVIARAKPEETPNRGANPPPPPPKAAPSRVFRGMPGVL